MANQMTYPAGVPEPFDPAQYEADLFRSFDALRPYLVGEDLTSILDIGSGLAGMDALIYRQFVPGDIHLLDGDAGLLGEKLNRYNDHDTVPWNDVNLGRSFVLANTIASPARVHAHTLFPRVKVNGVFSFRSWCHHYPAAVYAELVAEHLEPDGFIVTDIRRGTNGAAVFARHGFLPVAVIPDHSVKCTRMMFKRRLCDG